MCGIAGFWQNNSQHSPEQLEKSVSLMADALFMRGPDSSGTWCDPEIGLALGHRRLSIIDLSPAGHQPMVS
ncbi:MAG: asparagine synthetase B, partial [Gammaproteobacteria bacterium]